MPEPQWEASLTAWEWAAKFIPPILDGGCHLCLPFRPATTYVTQFNGSHLVDIPMCQLHTERTLREIDLPNREFRKD